MPLRKYNFIQLRRFVYFFPDENPEAFRRAPRNPPKRKESESAQSGSAGSESGSDSSGSGDSDSDSDSDSSASETSRSVKKPVALQIRNLSGRSNGEMMLLFYKNFAIDLGRE